MRLWIDTDIGDNPDDTIALWCAAHADGVDLAGVSTVDGDVDARAAWARALLPDANVVAGDPPEDQVVAADVLLGIGPWTHVAQLAASGSLPRRVVLMGGALGSVRHRDHVTRTEHNVASDPAAAAALLEMVGDLVVVPLDATARIHADERDERELITAIPYLGEQLANWRTLHGDLPLVLHDPAALLVALGEHVARTESKRLVVDDDGTMRASVRGPLQHVVAHLDGHRVRTRVRALAEGD